MILCFDRLLFLQIKQVIVDDCTPTEVRGLIPQTSFLLTGYDELDDIETS